MPQSLPNSDAIRRAVERVLSQGEYQLDPAPPQDTAVGDLFQSLRERLWDPVVEWWNQWAGRWPWADDVLAGLVLGVLVVLVVQMVRLRGRKPPSLLQPAPADVDLPAEFHRRAVEAGEQGRHVQAVRWLLQAAKLELEAAEHRVNRPGTTNRELLLRYGRTRLAAPLATLVEAVDRGWFGGRDCTRLDYLDCLSAQQEIASAAGGASPPTAAENR